MYKRDGACTAYAYTWAKYQADLTEFVSNSRYDNFS